MKNIIIFYKTDKKIKSEAKIIHKFLKNKGNNVKLISDQLKVKSQNIKNVDLIIPVGGDGPMIRASRLASKRVAQIER